MRLSVHADAAATAQAAAAWIASQLRAAVRLRGRAAAAFSGGASPRPMLEALGAMALPWERLVVFQVDERVAPQGSAARNLTALSAALPQLPAARLHPMPVECADDLESAARAYGSVLQTTAGTPATLDLVHLGLGDDGHVASLFAADPALEILDRDVVVTAVQRGYRRMSLSLPLLSRARSRVWLVTGADKSLALAALLRAPGPDPATDPARPPAARVARDGSIVFADVAAAAAASP